MRFVLISFYSLFLLSFKQSSVKVNQVCFDFTAKILEKGKYVSVSGEMYYDILNKKITTRIIKPIENITVVDLAGEMKIYDPKENTIIYSSSQVNSIESSYFHHFFNSEMSDMGLQKTGFLIQNTRVEDGLLVTTWVPKPESSTPIKSIDLAHQKSRIMYMGILSRRNKFLGKIFFSKYNNVGQFSIPYSITEFGYTEKGDSTVTKKIYSNARINELVNTKYLNFQVPSNAKVVKMQK